MTTFTPRNCKSCLQEFLPSGPRSLKCQECSKRLCTVCDKELSSDRTGKTCSTTCAYLARSKKAKEAVCAVNNCSNIFLKTNPQMKYCNEQHYSTCTICSKSFEVEASPKMKETCFECSKLRGDLIRKEARIAASRKKYGVDSVFSLPEIQTKARNTNMSRYGYANPFERKDVQDSIKDSNLEKYGVEWSSQRNDVKEKIKNTNLSRYGVTTPAKNKEILKRMQETSLKNNGHINPYASQAIKKKRVESSQKAYGVNYPMQSADFRESFSQIIKDKYGVAWPIQLPNAVPGRISKTNRVWKTNLEDQTGLDWVFEKFFAGVGNVDLYTENNGVKLAVEISPTPTHNSYMNKIACNRRGCTVLPCPDHGKPKDYHQMKTKLLKENHGVELITVFDWMNPVKIMPFIQAKLKLNSKKIGARKCELREITQREANSFLKEYHLLGASRKQTRCYGLFYNEELLQVQTFSPRKSERSWEAKRLATRTGYVVIGGISKVTKRFVEDENPLEIVAFTDLNLGYGSGFDSLYNGFQSVELQKPTLCWSKGDKMILQKSAAFQSADRLIGIANNSTDSPYPSDWSNEEVFLAEGWLPVWDCGKIKETWRKNEQ